jgi:hypothetical protein
LTIIKQSDNIDKLSAEKRRNRRQQKNFLKKVKKIFKNVKKTVDKGKWFVV